MKKKLTILSIILFLLLPSISFANETKQNVNIEAQAAILIDADTNDILFEHNAEKILPPASLTKIMTLAIVNDEIKKGTIDWDTPIKISKKAWQTGGSKMFIEVDKQVSVEDLVKGIAIVSGNDASVAIAEHISGSVELFINRMNKKAKEIGMTNTKFTSVNGLSYEDTTTAKDFATLSYHYLKNHEEMLEIHSTLEYEFNNIKQLNRNPMLTNYENADGLKTGFIMTNYNLISTAKRDGIRLIVVSLNSKTGGERFRTHRDLLNFGFTQYEEVNQGKKGEFIEEIPLYKVKNKKSTKVILEEDINYTLNINSTNEPKIEIILPEYLIGEMKKGTVIGEKIVTINNKTLKSNIVLAEDLEKAGFFQRIIDTIKLWFK